MPRISEREHLDDDHGLWQHLVHVLLLVERLAPRDPTALTVPAALRGINCGISLGPEGEEP
jgi:hypothetical protein